MRALLFFLAAFTLACGGVGAGHHHHGGHPTGAQRASMAGLPRSGADHDGGHHRRHGHGHGKGGRGAGWGGGHDGSPIRDPEAYMEMLERARTPDGRTRQDWQQPERVIEALKLRPGDHVADLGAGSGYFSRRLARAVPDGLVFAVDIEPAMLRRLRSSADELGLNNVVVVQGSPEAPGLPPASADLAIVVNTFHHFGDRARYLREVRRILRPGGRLVLVEWRPNPKRGFGPPAGALLPREALVKETEAVGFRLKTEHDFLPEQYFLVFEAAP